MEDMQITSEEKRKKAVLKAVNKYDQSKDKILARCPAGTLERIKKAGYSSGNAFAVKAILDRLEKEEKQLQI